MATEAEKIFTGAFFMTMTRFAAIYSFRRVAAHGLPAADSSIRNEALASVDLIY